MQHVPQASRDEDGAPAMTYRDGGEELIAGGGVSEGQAQQPAVVEMQQTPQQQTVAVISPHSAALAMTFGEIAKRNLDTDTSCGFDQIPADGMAKSTAICDCVVSLTFLCCACLCNGGEDWARVLICVGGWPVMITSLMASLGAFSISENWRCQYKTGWVLSLLVSLVGALIMLTVLISQIEPQRWIIEIAVGCSILFLLIIVVQIWLLAHWLKVVYRSQVESGRNGTLFDFY